MNNPKVSVIVAVYKAEKYIHKLMDSLLNQTLKDFEILLIDDGSPDNSGAICDEYSVKDKRVRVIHKENGGVSSARQCGVDNAKGEYTIHADPDDWVECDMLEMLYSKAKADDADMVLCDYFMEYPDHRVYKSYNPNSSYCPDIIVAIMDRLHGSCWNKLVRRTCYENFNVKYPIGISLFEDQFENISLLKNDIKVSYLPRAFYHYILDANPNSLTKRYDNSSYEQDIKLINLYDELLKGHVCHNFCISKQKCHAVLRAYNSGFFDSITFKSLFNDFKKDILKNNSFNINVKLRLFLSCIGLYSPIFKLSNSLKNILK